MKRCKSILLFTVLLNIELFSQSRVVYPNFSINSDYVKSHVNYLGSDKLEGRGTGTYGGELAANYIAEVFETIGLTPIGDNNSYFQSVPLHATSYLENSKLALYSNHDTLELEIGKDYLLSNSGEQTIIPSASELVFVGYGIIAPEFDHNDYLEKDLVGKIAVMLTGEPESSYEEYFNGAEPTIYSHSDVKHRVAISRGAAGTILIPPLDKDDVQTWNKLKREYSFEDVNLLYDASNSFGIILNPNVARKLFQDHIKGDNLQLTCNNVKTGSCQLMFEGQFLVRAFKADNVVGMVKANNSDLDEYVIVSAHYDHLGIGPEVNNDTIYNGVLDNALGVSALLEIAKKIKENEKLLTRSVIFIATTGEEKGLLGSSYYTDHPIFPLYKTVANINIDGIAMLDKFNSVVGVGSNLSNLSDILSVSVGKFGLAVDPMPSEFYSNEAFNRSDQIAFAKAGIPAILILDAPNYQNINFEEAVEKIIYINEKIYHSPFDDLSLEINYSAVVQHTQILSSFIFDISSTQTRIEWNENTPYNFIRLQTIAEKR